MNNIYKKTIVISIILLLIGVSLSSAISVDTKPIISNNEIVEDCGCNEVSDADLVKVERLLNRVEIYSKMLIVLSRYKPEIQVKIEELLDLINPDILWDFPIICDILESIWNQSSNMHKIISDLAEEYKNNPIILGILACFVIPLDILRAFIVTLKTSFGCDFGPSP